MAPVATLFFQILQPERVALMDLAVEGEFVRASNAEAGASGAKPRPACLDSSCPECGAALVNEAQFWAHGRLWSLGFCPDWMEHDGLEAAFLSSAGGEDGLVEGEQVAGNSAWARTPAKFLVLAADPRRSQHPVLLALGLAEEEDEAFEEALAEVIGATVPGSDAARKLGVRSYTASRLGGTESPIQADHAHAKCGQCEQPLVFLGQFDENTGFHFADAGAAYVFACLQHPGQVLVDCQTH